MPDAESVADRVFNNDISPVGDDKSASRKWSRDFYGAIADRAQTMHDAIDDEMDDEDDDE